MNLQGAGTFPGLLRLTRGSTDPALGSGDGDFLYSLNGNLVYEAAGVTTTLGAVGGVGTTWESLYANDSAWALTGAFTITQSGNTAFTLNKTGTGAGTVFELQNAGTGDDFSTITTRASSTGVIWDSHHDSASPADADVIFEHQVNGEDDGSTKLQYGRIRFLSDDVSAGTEDATYQLALMVAGTSRTCLAVTGPTITVGDGATNATITTSGALDLILSTNAGTNSGTIRIYDGANGNIELLNNGSGDVTVPTSGIVQGGTTATRCTFAVAGTTAQGFDITTATITTGDVLRINHSVAATLDGGFLLNCTVENTSVLSVGESGQVVIAGSAVGTAALTLTAGNILMSDGNFALTSTGTTDVFAITCNSLLANNAFIVSGSGTFTGTTTSSFFAVVQTGGTAGTTGYFSSSTATDSVAVVDISAAALTSGSALRITPGSATFTTGGKCIELEGGSAVAGNYLTATTTGAYTGTGMILLTAGAATTGILLSLVSTTGMTSGSLLRMTTSTAGAVATNGICSIRATGAYTSTSNAGLLDVVASALVGTGTIVNIQATNGSQLTNTALNVEQTTTTTGYTGDFVRIVGTSTTGDCNLIAVTSASTSAGDALSITGNGLVAGTSTLVNLVHGTSVLGAGNSMLRITSTSSDTGTTTGCLLDLASSAATAGTLVLVTSATLATGSGMVMALAGLTTGVGFSMTHATAVIANGGSMFRLNSGGIDTATTSGCLVDLTSTASTAGTQVLMTFSGLTGGKGMRMVADAMTGGMMIDLETSAAGFTGNYIRCYDGAAVDFSVSADGVIVQTATVITTTSAYTLTADSATTVGNGANTGVVDISGDGLTSGTLLNLSITDGTLTTGRYIKGWDVTRGAEDFAVIEDGVAYFAEGVATTAGGAIVMSFGTSQAFDIVVGSGAPILTASQGSLYLRSDGSSTSTRMYVNTDGAGTWTNVTTAA